MQQTIGSLHGATPKVRDARKIGRRVAASSPEKLTADAMRAFKQARRTAVTDAEEAEAEAAWSLFVAPVAIAAGNFANLVLMPRQCAILMAR